MRPVIPAEAHAYNAWRFCGTCLDGPLKGRVIKRPKRAFSCTGKGVKHTIYDWNMDRGGWTMRHAN